MKVNQIGAVLNEAIEYSHGMAEFDTKRFQRAIGSPFDGLDTPVDALTRLRGWYKKVRETYGIGFGPKVAVGDGILSLQSKLLRGVQQFKEKGFDTEL